MSYREPPWGEDRPGWLLAIVVIWMAIVYVGSAIGFLWWAIHH